MSVEQFRASCLKLVDDCWLKMVKPENNFGCHPASSKKRQYCQKEIKSCSVFSSLFESGCVPGGVYRKGKLSWLKKLKFFPKISYQVKAIANANLQAIIDQVPNGTQIILSPGDYLGPVVIPSSKSNLWLKSEIPGTARIIGQLGTVITILGQAIRLTGLIVIGSGDTSNGRASTDIAVLEKATAIIDNNLLTFDTSVPLRNVFDARSINVDTGSQAVIVANKVTEYQKLGMRLNGKGSMILAFNNLVIGAGVTSIVVQNGIQVSREANVWLQNNTCQNNSTLITGFTATGILSFQQPATVETIIKGNLCINNQTGIGLAETDAGIFFGNSIKNNQVGLLVENSNKGNQIVSNCFKDNTILDINDMSTGVGTAGTAGTANFYHCNRCSSDNTGQICQGTVKISTGHQNHRCHCG